MVTFPSSSTSRGAREKSATLRRWSGARRAALPAVCALVIAFTGFHFSSRQASPRLRALTEAPRPLAAIRGTGFQSLFRQAAGLRIPRADVSSLPSQEEEQELEPVAEEEETEGRNDWFLFQRTYPFGSIPRDSRLRAWAESQARYQPASEILPQANKTWRSIGPSPTISSWSFAWGVTSGRVNSIAVSPADSRLVLLGSSTGGIWRSTDGGESFTPVSDDQVDLAVGSLAFSKSNPSIAYAGMGDTKLGYLGSGVLKSTDSGSTWTLASNSSLPAPGSVSRLEIDPANPNKLYVAQYSKVSGDKVTSSGLYLSTDGGVRWIRALAGAPRDVVLDPGNSRTVYAGMSRIDNDADPPFGLYRSTDGGGNWANVFTAPAQYDLTKRRDFKVAISPVNPQRMYAYFGGFILSGLDAHLRASTDAGATWTERSLAGVDLAQFAYNSYLFCDPSDALTLYLGSRDLYRSTDGGESWTNLTRNFYDLGGFFQYAPGSSNTHPDQHALAFSPANPGEYYLGNDGGVSKTTDGGATFQSLNSTLTLSQFIGIAAHPTNPAIIYGGTQDNGSQRLGDSPRWYETVTGDGGHTVINPLNPSVVFMTYVRGDIFRFVSDGLIYDAQAGYNGAFGEFAATPRMLFYPPFVGNGVNANLYFGTWRLFISTDLGGSWLAPAGFQDLTKGVNAAGADVLSAIAVARSNTNVIYTGSSQGRAMVSTNGGASWSDITRGLPDRYVTSIAVDPGSPSTAYLAVSGFNSGHIFRTTNTGSSWTDISGDLPNIPANALLIDPVARDTIYAGTDVGVFRSSAQGGSWRSFSKGMPPAVVTELVAQASGLIQAATYGRGVYVLDPNQPPVIESAIFNGKKRITITGSGFGDSPTVLINDRDRSDRISESSDGEITLVGKIKKLGLVEGDNTVQVVTSEGLSSNVVIIRL